MKLFIAGTDTNVGKTFISEGLIQLFNQQGMTTLGIKPLASGSELVNNKLYNGDALALQRVSSVKLSYDQINPFVFESPVAPSIVALKANVKLSVSALIHRCDHAINYLADIHVIEGVGGWYVPLNQSETMADFVKALNLDVVLVVGIRLGCLNHAILTINAIKQSGLKLSGWVANCINCNIQELDENILTLKRWIKAPCIGVVPYGEAPERNLNVNYFY